MTNFEKGFIKRAMLFGATEKQANELLAAAQPNTNHQWRHTEPALHVDNNWKRPVSSRDPKPNYTMSPVHVAGTFAENSLNPNAVAVPRQTLHVPTMLQSEFKYNPENKFDFSQPAPDPINHIAAIK